MNIIVSRKMFCFWNELMTQFICECHYVPNIS